MKLEFEITKVTILKTQGPDKIMLHTTTSTPYVPRAKIIQPLLLQFDVSAEDGYRYVTKVLKVKPELIEVLNVR